MYVYELQDRAEQAEAQVRTLTRLLTAERDALDTADRWIVQQVRAQWASYAQLMTDATATDDGFTRWDAWSYRSAAYTTANLLSNIRHTRHTLRALAGHRP